MKTRFRTVETGVRLPDQFSGFVLSSELGIDTYRAYDEVRVFSLRFDIGIDFSCNSANYRRAVKDATKTIVRALNAETLSELDGIRMAIHQGDREKALTLCDRAESRLSGGEL